MSDEVLYGDVAQGFPMDAEDVSGDTAEVVYVDSPEELERLDRIAQTLDMVLLQTQEEAAASGTSANIGTVCVDGDQWGALDARVATLEANSSVTLYVSMLLVCAVGLCAGGQLWRVFVQSYRR